MDVLDRVRTAVQDAPLDPAGLLVVGVSGGPDSLCLLDCLHRLGMPLLVAHFDHQLRAESGEDARQVARMAAERGLPYEQAAADVAAFAGQERLSLEEAARILRYRFLFATARRAGAQAVAVGHTADDQVETVLMHLLRGAGLAGLKGMLPLSTLEAWDERISLARPLLGVWRTEIEAYCQERGLAPLRDATNQQVTYFRNRLRHELVPELQRYNPQAKEVLLRTAEVLAGDWQVVEWAAEQAWPELLLEAAPDLCAVDREKLRALPVGLQRVILRRMIALLRPGLRDIDFETVERGLAFCAQPTRSRSLELSQGLRLTWEAHRLVLSEGAFERMEPDWPSIPAGVEWSLGLPGQLDLGDGWRLWVGEAPAAPDYHSASAWEAWLDRDALEFPLVVRTARPGERFQPLGMQGRSQKLSDFWINAGLPRRARGGWPLVCSAGQVVWIPGYRLAEGARVRETTRQVAHLRLSRVVGGAGE